MKKEKKRCPWSETNELFIPYHDKEWGVPVHDDRLLFEMINLEGAQAGLSWLTILKKRERYKEVFANFEAKKVSKFTSAKLKVLVKDPGIVRHPGKIKGVVSNAKAYLEVKKEFGSFNAYIWKFSENKIFKGSENKKAVKVSEIMSKELKKRGFTFVGPTICYAFMQAIGMINDHAPSCFRAKELK